MRKRISKPLQNNIFLSRSESVHFFYRLPLEIQLSRWEGCDPINRFNPATFLYLSQASTIWISNISYVCFVDIDGIDDHHIPNINSIYAWV